MSAGTPTACAKRCSSSRSTRRCLMIESLLPRRPLFAMCTLALVLVLGIAFAVISTGQKAGAVDPTFVTAGPCDPVATCGGSNSGGAIGVLPGNTGTISLGSGLFSVSYSCPAILTTTAKGTLTFTNTTGDVMNVFNDRKKYVRLAAGASTTLKPKVTGDYVDWQIQHPTLGLA